MFEESECDGLSSDLRYLQISFSFEPPTSEYDGQTSDLLWYLQTSLELPTSITEMTAFTK